MNVVNVTAAMQSLPNATSDDASMLVCENAPSSQLDEVLHLAEGTVQFLSAFVVACLGVSFGMVVFGKLGLFWKIHEWQEGGHQDSSSGAKQGENGQDDVGSQRVATWPDLDISDPQKNQDIVGARLESPIRVVWLENLLLPYLTHERNKELLSVLVSATCVLIPMAALVFALFCYAPFPVAFVYGAGVYQYVRMSYFMHGMQHYRHFTTHAPLFRSYIANVLPSLYLDPFMGMSPLAFRLHHPIMHHIANNGIDDISSTEMYRGDSWTDFAMYWFRYQVLAYLELPHYAIKTGRYSWFLTLVSVIGSFLLTLQWLSENVSGWATFLVFGIPWILDHGMDGMRNWCQHNFVIPVGSKHAGSTHFHYNCGHAINVVDDEHNRRTFNEGYHVIHHSWGGKPWSQMAPKFYEEVEKLKTCEEDVLCLTFRRTSVWKVFLHTATPGKLDKFVRDHFVHIPTAARPKPPTVREVVDELRARCGRVNSTVRAKEMARFMRH